MSARMLFIGVFLVLILFPFRMAEGREPMPTPDETMVNRTAARLNDQGVVLFRDGRLEEALGYFILASEADPAFAIAHYNCAVVLAARGFEGDTEEAIRHLERSYKLDPFDQDILEFLVELRERIYQRV